MANVEITTLTPVHVGSGATLQNQSEYLHFSHEGVIAIVDPEKVFAIVGEQGLDSWTASITRGEDLLNYLKQRKKNLKPEDVATRILPLTGERPGKQVFLREHMRTGTGQVLVPGTSIKGAIRTAVLAQSMIRK
jgi:CRISPR type III-A-associated RAMP protein Csm5